MLSHICTYHSVHKSYYQYFLFDTISILCCIIIRGKYSSSRNRQIFVSAHELCRFVLELYVELVAWWLIILPYIHKHTLSFFTQNEQLKWARQTRKNHRYHIWETWLSHGGMWNKRRRCVWRKESGRIYLSLTYLTFACIILMILALISLRHISCVSKAWSKECEVYSNTTNRISENVCRFDQKTAQKRETRIVGIRMRYCFDTSDKTPRKMLPRSAEKWSAISRHTYSVCSFGEPETDMSLWVELSLWNEDGIVDL